MENHYLRAHPQEVVPEMLHLSTSEKLTLLANKQYFFGNNFMIEKSAKILKSSSVANGVESQCKKALEKSERKMISLSSLTHNQEMLGETEEEASVSRSIPASSMNKVNKLIASKSDVEDSEYELGDDSEFSDGCSKPHLSFAQRVREKVLSFGSDSESSTTEDEEDMKIRKIFRLFRN